MSHSASPKTPAQGAEDNGHHLLSALAAQIYIQLAKESMVMGVSDAGHTPTLNADAGALARFSFKLAEAFLLASEEIRVGTQPKFAKFDVDKLDFDSWTSK
jgi:hypothetical protein